MVVVDADQRMGWSFWVDRGGTFTDLIGCDLQGSLHVRKLLSESADGGDPAVMAMAELVGCSTASAIPAGLISSVRLGTTVATNALLEHQQAPLLLLTNAGLADQLRIGDQHRSDLFALDPPSRPFLAQQVLEVSGRLDASGAEVEPLQLDSALRQSLSDQQRLGIDVAVVALLHAHRTARAQPTQKRTGAHREMRLRSSVHGFVSWDAAMRDSGGTSRPTGRQHKHSIRPTEARTPTSTRR